MNISLNSMRAFAVKEVGVIAALFVATAGVLAFLGIADEMAEGATARIDHAILYGLRAANDPSRPLGPHWLELSAIDITSFGSATGLGLIVLLVAGLFVSLRRWREAAIIVAAPLTGMLVSNGLKLLFARQRPDSLVRAVEVANASFPSGHALLSAVTYLTLAALIARFTKDQRLTAYALAAGVLVTLLVGVSRVYLGAHWPSDVLAGWCAGAAWALFWWLAVWTWERWRGREVADE